MNLTKITEEEYAQLEAHILSKSPIENTKEKFDPLLHAYRVWLLEYMGDPNCMPGEYYNSKSQYAIDYETARGMIRLINPPYSQDTLAHFCIDLILFTNLERFSETGLFLSAYINLAHEKTGEKEYVLDLSLLDVPLFYVGTQNTANILIHGNVEDFLGKYMQGGSIILKGNAESYIGEEMHGGKIIVENTKDNVGNNLCYGTIIVNGNAEVGVGSGMTGGEIYLNGTYTKLGHIRGGIIYHKNKIILERKYNFGEKI